MGIKAKLILGFISIALLPEMAMASIDPGAGIGPFSALWGLILGVVMALGIVLFWPIRMLLRKRKTAAQGSKAESAAENPAASTTNADNKT